MAPPAPAGRGEDVPGSGGSGRHDARYGRPDPAGSWVVRTCGPPPSYPQDAQSAVEMLIIQRSQIAAFSSCGTLAACPKRPYIPSCAEHGAGVGRSNTGRLYEAARKGKFADAPDMDGREELLEERGAVITEERTDDEQEGDTR